MLGICPSDVLAVVSRAKGASMTRYSILLMQTLNMPEAR
jgi:hypothetical protein